MTTPADIPQHIDTQYSEQMLIKAPFGQSKEEFLAGINEKLQAERKEALRAISEKFKKSKRYEELKDVVSFNYSNGILVACSDGIPVSFYKYNKENGVEFYSDFGEIFESEDYEFGVKSAGYEDKEGKIFKDGKEIPRFLDNGEMNPLFIKAIDNIIFYIHAQITYGGVNNIYAGGKLTEYDADSFYRFIVSGACTINEIIVFKAHGYITDKEFPRLFERAIKELPRQCADERLYKDANGKKMGVEITKKDLDNRFTPIEGEPLIKKETYDRCVKIIEERDRLIKDKEAQKVKTSAEIGKQRSGIIIAWMKDMVEGILS